MEKDLEPLFCDMNKFPQCTVKIIGFTPTSVKANVAVKITGEDTEVKSFLETKAKEAMDKELTNTKAKVENDMSVSYTHLTLPTILLV